MNIPAEIKEKIFLADGLFGSAMRAEGQVREWLMQQDLVKRGEEATVDEHLTRCVRHGDGGANAFIAYLEEPENPIDWKSNASARLCGFTVDENREGQVWIELQWSMRRMDDAPDGEFPWELIEFPICQRFLLGHDDLCWLAEVECWEEYVGKDCAEYLSNEEAAEYLISSCPNGRLALTEVGYSTPCGSYFFDA